MSTVLEIRDCIAESLRPIPPWLSERIDTEMKRTVLGLHIMASRSPNSRFSLIAERTSARIFVGVFPILAIFSFGTGSRALEPFSQGNQGLEEHLPLLREVSRTARISGTLSYRVGTRRELSFSPV